MENQGSCFELVKGNKSLMRHIGGGLAEVLDFKGNFGQKTMLQYIVW